MHRVNTMKIRRKTINRPITSIADSQLSVELSEVSGNTTICSTINSTDQQLIVKSDKTSVECRYRHAQQRLSVPPAAASDLIIIQTDKLELHAKRVKTNINTYISYSSKRMNARNAIACHCRHLQFSRTYCPH